MPLRVSGVPPDFDTTMVSVSFSPPAPAMSRSVREKPSGSVLSKKKIGGVEYSLGSIPAGGFVALPQLAPMEVMEGKVETLAKEGA